MVKEQKHRYHQHNRGVYFNVPDNAVCDEIVGGWSGRGKVVCLLCSLYYHVALEMGER